MSEAGTGLESESQPGPGPGPGPEAESPREAEPSFRARALLWGRDLAVILLVALLASFLLKTFLIRSFTIPSSSMERTLEQGDHVMVNQLVPGVVGVSRGDVVVFRDPGGWLSPSEVPAKPQGIEVVLQALGLAPDTQSGYLIKRVIGVAGDRVTCCDAEGRMSVNGTPLAEPYAVVPSGAQRVSAIDFDVTVPKGAVWVMGDNRYNSRDSRYHQSDPDRGFVSNDEIVGRAFLINWPLSRLGWLGDYPEVFADVPAKPE